ncbi:FIST signal transduction protein [Clostridium magnum]|uniref:FIST signal transduction protein n=1 Tax=Clostridium magnum TaxID=33954 RepID=UPI00092202ED|nr:FIST C-terminal domain-containing protein [Clostridium magnum]SHJ47540.1 FIST N domain-containing protein [Clostridium magnum DSM 2767]
MYLKSFFELKEYIENVKVESTENLMIMVAEKSAENVNELIGYANDKNIKIFGGIYSRLLVGNKSHSEGFIIQKYEPLYTAMVLPYLMRFKLSLENFSNCTAIVLVDGLSSKMKDLTDTVYNKLGKNVKYIGGGAGFYDLKHRPCIFDNKGLFSDVLYICIVKSDAKIAVKHGWNKLEGPFLAKVSEENTLAQLDEYSAFEVYKDVIEEHENIRLLKQDFFVYAKDHPFGIAKENQVELIVRDPIRVNDNNEIVCVADIPQGSEIYVLKGDANTLLSSSLQIAEQCAAIAPKNYIPLLFDCISRAMFLEELFEEELKNIQDNLSFTVEGALSIGEIASQDNGQLVIHNKSTILGLLQID